MLPPSNNITHKCHSKLIIFNSIHMPSSTCRLPIWCHHPWWWWNQVVRPFLPWNTGTVWWPRERPPLTWASTIWALQLPNKRWLPQWFTISHQRWATTPHYLRQRLGWPVGPHIVYRTQIPICRNPCIHTAFQGPITSKRWSTRPTLSQDIKMDQRRVLGSRGSMSYSKKRWW